jgi:hypothetical protein
MKNIYDIISEQKYVVDVNIASYDLEYVATCFNKNEYLQEGVGETVKNVAKKVIEFIETMIRKIKELVKKIINYILGKRGNGYQKAMQQVKSKSNSKPNDEAKNKDEQSTANSGGSTTDNASNSNGNVYDKNMFKGVDMNSLTIQDIFKGSLRTVSIIKYAPFEKKAELGNNFLDSVNVVVRNYSENENANEIKDVFIKSIERTCFNGAGSFKTNKDKSLTIAQRARLELGESEEPVEMKVKDIDMDVFLSYCGTDTPDGDRNAELKAFFDKMDKESTMYLNKLKSRLQSVGSDDASIGRVEQVISMVGSFVNFLMTDVFKAYNTLDKLAQQVVRDFLAVYK